MMSTVWNISAGQLGLAAWLRSLPAPAHLLSMRNWIKVLGFIVTTENISVINIRLILNPKHSSY